MPGIRVAKDRGTEGTSRMALNERAGGWMDGWMEAWMDGWVMKSPENEERCRNGEGRGF